LVGKNAASKGLPAVFSCTSRVSGAARTGAQCRASSDQPPRIIELERRQRDLYWPA